MKDDTAELSDSYEYWSEDESQVSQEVDNLPNFGKKS